jgi:hypothetical protein
MGCLIGAQRLKTMAATSSPPSSPPFSPDTLPSPGFPHISGEQLLQKAVATAELVVARCAPPFNKVGFAALDGVIIPVLYEMWGGQVPPGSGFYSQFTELVAGAMHDNTETPYSQSAYDALVLESGHGHATAPGYPRTHVLYFKYLAGIGAMSTPQVAHAEIIRVTELLWPDTSYDPVDVALSAPEGSLLARRVALAQFHTMLLLKYCCNVPTCPRFQHWWLHRLGDSTKSILWSVKSALCLKIITPSDVVPPLLLLPQVDAVPGRTAVKPIEPIDVEWV